MDNLLPEYEIKELPSRFISYPELAKIYVKPFTFGAALNLQIVGKGNINTLEEILSGVKVVNMEKSMLTPQDILFLGVYRNLVSSVHDKINIKSICPKCLKENNVQKTLASIKFKTIDDFNKDCYPLEVDLNEYTMWFGFVSYDDFTLCMQKYRGDKLYQLALQVLKYQNKSTGELIEKPDYSLTSKSSSATKEIEKYVNNVRNILYSMVDEDKDTLDEVINLLEDYGLKPVEVICSDENCKNEYTIDFNDEDILVTPFRDPKKSTRDRIKLSKKSDDVSIRSEANEFEGSGAIVRLNNEKEQ